MSKSPKHAANQSNIFHLAVSIRKCFILRWQLSRNRGISRVARELTDTRPVLYWEWSPFYCPGAERSRERALPGITVTPSVSLSTVRAASERASFCSSKKSAFMNFCLLSLPVAAVFGSLWQMQAISAGPHTVF